MPLIYTHRKGLQAHVDYIPGPLECPGVYNRKPSKGPIMRRLVYAIPLEREEIDRFILKYWPGSIPPNAQHHPKFSQFLRNFPGRPEETKLITLIHVCLPNTPVKWDTLAVVLGTNFTPEAVEKAENCEDVVRKIHKYFEMDREAGWYPFTDFLRDD
ncbi:hypothetical protein BJ165DRAFT_1535131 [Panaeolus papilionaceus]|nr:hypothetical protein BJ165DRAFT_1535131 [Panaeolus papilionaceus]